VPRVSDWERQFGAKRRAKDRALLKEVEKQITLEERARPAYPVNDELRVNIAKAFGRPLN
jgi:hypothetical protein